MDTSTYDEAIFAMRDVIFRDYPFAIVRERLLELCVGEQNIAFVDTICSELGVACLQPLSGVVNRATMIIAQLAVNGGEQVSMRMSQKDFQDYLMYTLRRLTTKLGNLLTMHPEVWSVIQTRVLNLYSYWYHKYENQDGKYFHALQRYRALRQSNIPFPEHNPYLQSLNNKKTVEVKPPVNPELLNDIKQLVEWCSTKVVEGNVVDIMNTACVRNIKSRSQQLYKIWTTQSLPAEQKEKVKEYYSSLRKISKLIDAENEKKKAEEEKTYLENKKNKLQTASSKDGKVVSPQKSDLLGDGTKTQVQSPRKVPSTSTSPTKTLQNQIQLIDLNDFKPPKAETKPIDMTKQLMQVFSSQQEIRSDKQIMTPPKAQKPQSNDEFSIFSIATPEQEQVPAVKLINEDTDSPTRLKRKQDDYVDLI